MGQIEIIQGDITTVSADAIVNAANTTLLGGGGVDGAIHRAAGPKLLEECRSLNGCRTGEAKITQGYNIPVRYIIHTVGPVWRGGHKSEHTLLAHCYKNSLTLALDYKIQAIAFPSISTGVYRFPIELAANIALTEINVFLQSNDLVKKVIIVCFDQITYKTYCTLHK
ncbi:MAG: O-acetyl-ADP-ribose deacetylase [Candidatus Omnitrophica bacterium]|nr:O-acetyl-ADP-ribose deacetylase [Candidatus Omnitrophota bacterium]